MISLNAAVDSMNDKRLVASSVSLLNIAMLCKWYQVILNKPPEVLPEVLQGVAARFVKQIVDM